MSSDGLRNGRARVVWHPLQFLGRVRFWLVPFLGYAAMLPERRCRTSETARDPASWEHLAQPPRSLCSDQNVDDIRQIARTASENGLHRVLRAGGHVAASGRENWRDGPLVSAKQLQRERVEDPVHVREISFSRKRQIARRLLPPATIELKSLHLTRVKPNF